jgi:hypothetical protein
MFSGMFKLCWLGACLHCTSSTRQDTLTSQVPVISRFSLFGPTYDPNRAEYACLTARWYCAALVDAVPHPHLLAVNLAETRHDGDGVPGTAVVGARLVKRRNRGSNNAVEGRTLHVGQCPAKLHLQWSRWR